MITTFEEAKRCPKCDVPGREQLKTASVDGSKVFVAVCVNEACKWYETGWVIQVDRNGEIPVRGKGQKDYPDFPGFIRERAQRDLDTVKAAAEGNEEAAQELTAGGEIVDVDRKK